MDPQTGKFSVTDILPMDGLVHVFVDGKWASSQRAVSFDISDCEPPVRGEV